MPAKRKVACTTPEAFHRPQIPLIFSQTRQKNGRHHSHKRPSLIKIRRFLLSSNICIYSGNPNLNSGRCTQNIKILSGLNIYQEWSVTCQLVPAMHDFLNCLRIPQWSLLLIKPSRMTGSLNTQECAAAKRSS